MKNTTLILNTVVYSVHQASKEDEDDFLCGETPHTDGIVGMTPSSFGSNICSPSSMGSPPFTHQQPL